jgi:hypothetical protein
MRTRTFTSLPVVHAIVGDDEMTTPPYPKHRPGTFRPLGEPTPEMLLSHCVYTRHAEGFYAAGQGASE